MCSSQRVHGPEPDSHWKDMKTDNIKTDMLLCNIYLENTFDDKRR